MENDPTQRQTGKEEPYAYTITDKIFGELRVLNSANAWWIDQGKVRELIQAYKIDATDEEACSYAGISLDQLKYFKELHPDFSNIKQACKQLPTLSARDTLVKSIKTDPEMALKYLERKRKREFGRNVDIMTDGESLNKPTTFIIKNFEDESEN